MLGYWDTVEDVIVYSMNCVHPTLVINLGLFYFPPYIPELAMEFRTARSQSSALLVLSETQMDLNWQAAGDKEEGKELHIPANGRESGCSCGPAQCCEDRQLPLRLEFMCVFMFILLPWSWKFG